ncbi:hypothetical protein J6590_097624 [Homalodisca vitripennis]|nr:hypothetical protein J6590_097624 [Homalodisca vitripennis]
MRVLSARSSSSSLGSFAGQMAAPAGLFTNRILSGSTSYTVPCLHSGYLRVCACASVWRRQRRNGRVGARISGRRSGTPAQNSHDLRAHSAVSGRLRSVTWSPHVSLQDAAAAPSQLVYCGRTVYYITTTTSTTRSIAFPRIAPQLPPVRLNHFQSRTTVPFLRKGPLPDGRSTLDSCPVPA